MSYVVYTSSNYNQYNRGNWFSRLLASKSVRASSGLCAGACSVAATYLCFHFFSLFALQFGMFGVAAIVAVSGVCIGITAVRLFQLLRGKKVAAFIGLAALFGASFIVPGVPIIVALGMLALSVLHILYWVATSALDSRTLAVAIAAVPVIGASYYVPKAIDNAGLRLARSTPASVSVPQDLEAPLVGLRRAMHEGIRGSRAATLTYKVVENSLYAHICTGESVQSVYVDTRELVKTPVAWLQKDLRRELARLTAGGQRDSIARRMMLRNTLSPIAEQLRSYSHVMVANGDIVNFPHQEALPETKTVIRSSTIDASLPQRIRSWAASQYVGSDEIAFINALPSTKEELASIGADGTWAEWENFFSRFNDVARSRKLSASQGVQKAEVLSALQSKKAVVVVIAHCDGFSVRLSSGETVTVDDLSSIEERIKENNPTVFLFSCETARLENLGSFAKSLMEHGAKGVVAPAVQIRAETALKLLEELLRELIDEGSSMQQAFEKAIEASGARVMELWLGAAEKGADGSEVDEMVA